MSFIHQKSEVDPKTILGKNIYICAFASIRADEGQIQIGNNTSIQESCVVHGKNVSIGNNVTVGHGAIVHGCQVGDNVIVGMNSTLLNGCKIGENSIIGAGAVVLENFIVPPKSLVAGVPAKILRQCNEEDAKLIARSANAYIEKLKLMGKYEE